MMPQNIIKHKHNDIKAYRLYVQKDIEVRYYQTYFLLRTFETPYIMQFFPKMEFLDLIFANLTKSSLASALRIIFI